jgi:ABC transporter substrate binding protein (PQQ-dependent alcohol dehydrogenase system)
VRFGADALNDRFAARFGTPMTAQAWTSWFAVKALWEASLRMKSSEPSTLAAYLVRDTTQFDGHKGRPLSFRAWDRQLRQFVYARVQGKLIDVPQQAPADIRSRAFLDRLGTSAAESKCRATP